jgi:hypothetical protein
MRLPGHYHCFQNGFLISIELSPQYGLNVILHRFVPDAKESARFVQPGLGRGLPLESRMALVRPHWADNVPT